MMEHEIVEDFKIQWTCELCGAANTDYFNLTVFPYCEGWQQVPCGESFDWSEILSQEEIDGLLAKMEPSSYQILLEQAA